MTRSDPPSDDIDAVAELLRGRLASDHLLTRLRAEMAKEAPSKSSLHHHWRTLKRDLGRNVLRRVLAGTFTLGRGRRNLLSLSVRSNELTPAKLAPAFEGFRILHLSDLHLDMNSGLSGSLISQLVGIQCDLCVITGDFRARTFGPIEACMQELWKVRASINCPVLAVLGNHDSLRMVPRIEAMGIKLLMNEAYTVRRGDASLHLAGVDDPHYFRVDNLAKAVHGLPAEHVRILLAHSPELFDHAATEQIDVYLCGHTHGGQICLPGGLPLIRNARAPRAYCAGAWRHREMQGYTSRGSGASIVDVRFNCAPELTIHTLRRTESVA